MLQTVCAGGVWAGAIIGLFVGISRSASLAGLAGMVLLGALGGLALGFAAAVVWLGIALP